MEILTYIFNTPADTSTNVPDSERERLKNMVRIIYARNAKETAAGLNATKLQLANMEMEIAKNGGRPRHEHLESLKAMVKKRDCSLEQIVLLSDFAEKYFHPKKQ